MKSLRAKLARLAAAVVASLIVATSSYAAPLTVLDYSGGDSPGLAMELTSGGVFQTAGAGAVESLLNWAGFIPVADGLGKITISGVTLNGTALVVLPGVYAQATIGGRIEITDLSDVLLLSVDFTDGLLQVTASGVGSQFTVGTSTFGGPLGAYLVPTSATHSLSLVNFTPAGINEQTGQLLAGSGFGNGVVAGEQVPEPMTLLLLGSGLIGGIAARRKAA